MLAVCIAPLWFGGVGEASQVMMAALISAALMVSFTSVHCIPETVAGKVALCGVVVICFAGLLPFPRGLGAGREFGEIAAGTFAYSFAAGETVMRCWQLAMMLGIFLLAREATGSHRFLSSFCVGLAMATIALGGTEIWRMIDGRGIWAEARHYPGGTFANRNHFANWMVAAAMFLFGAVLRKARSIKAIGAGRRDVLEATVYSGAVLCAIGTVIACGSRGGMMALVVGVCAWAGILWKRRVRGIPFLAFGGLLAALVLFFAVGGERVMARSGDGGLEFKMRIWSESLGLVKSFPTMGIGLGAFADVFSARKTSHGEGTILYVENEYLQWLVEAGIAGTLFAALGAFCIGRVIVKGFRAEGISKQDYFHGAIAALAAVLAHSFFEFVFHVMATALLASALLGIAHGLARRSTRNVEPGAGKADFIGTTILITFLMAMAIPQARAMHYSSRNADANGWSKAAKAWPINRELALEATRRVVAVAETTGGIPSGIIGSQQAEAQAREILATAMRWRPYDWELRLESAWLEMAFGNELEAAIHEIERARALNPLQAKIPLRFAAALTAIHPEHALEYAKAAPTSSYEDVREALRIGWRVRKETAVLWELTPVSETGLRALAQFAREEGLEAVAVEAEARAVHVAGNRH